MGQFKKIVDINKRKSSIPHKRKTIEKATEDFLFRAKGKVKESTFANYSFTSERHIIPYFKGVKLDEIDNEIINDFIDYKIQEGKLNGDPMSAKTVSDIVSLLIQIIKNHCQLDIDIDKPSCRQKEITIFTEIEYNKLKAFLLADMDNKKLGIIVTMLTGIRIGELCALKWGDIDLENETLFIDKTIQRIQEVNNMKNKKTKIIIEPPKTSASIRTIPLPQTLLHKLKAFKTSDEKYLLTNTEKYIEPRVYQRHFKSYLEKCKIKDNKFHTTRHTFATMAISRGMDIKTLSVLLGHSDVAFTMKRYVHPNIEHKKIQIEKIAVGF